MEDKNKTDIKSQPLNNIVKNALFKTKFKNNENILLFTLEIKNNKLIMEITDTDAIGNGLYKNEWSKEDLDKISRCFKSVDNINEIFENIKSLVINKKTNYEFDENSEVLKFNLDAINISKKEIITLVLKKGEMSDKDIINQLCQKVKILNLKVNQNSENNAKTKILKKLNSNIILNEDEFCMINDQIEEKCKKKISGWVKIFTASEDGDTAESFHSKCDGIENTVVLVKTKKYKRFGGFTKNKWNHNNGGYSNDSKAFLFSLTSMDIFNRNDNGCEQQGNKGYGPWFGTGPDFQIANQCFTINSVHNKKCYIYPQNIAFPLAESNNFLVKEYEVFKIEFETKSK